MAWGPQGFEDCGERLWRGGHKGFEDCGLVATGFGERFVAWGPQGFVKKDCGVVATWFR